MDGDEEIRGTAPELCQLPAGAHDRCARFIAEGRGGAGDGGRLYGRLDERHAARERPAGDVCCAARRSRRRRPAGGSTINISASASPDYMEEHGVDWDVVFDARAHFTEPHDGKIVNLGTLDVRSYLDKIRGAEFEEPELNAANISTHGPDCNFGAVLFIEKEGFQPLFERVKLAEQQTVQEENAKGDEGFWEAMRDMGIAGVEEHRALIARAETKDRRRPRRRKRGSGLRKPRIALRGSGEARAFPAASARASGA